MKNFELYNGAEVLRKIMSQETDNIDLVYRLSIFMEEANKYLKSIEESRNRIIKNIGTEQEDGGYIIDEKNTKKIQEFYSLFDEILQKDCDLTPIMLKLKDLEGFKLSANDLILLRNIAHINK